MEANLALPAAVIGDPVRAAILSALSDGRAQPAGALAGAARVSPQCASNHLAKLTEGGLLAVETEGRHRYYRLATPQIAAAIEALACLAPAIRSLENPRTSRARSLKFARSCYDHLVGRLGVAVAAVIWLNAALLAAAALCAPRVRQLPPWPVAQSAMGFARENQVRCQSALKLDPQSASNRDPSEAVGSGLSR
jgi:DNA-binding transcriptional ArsR family regulator